MLKPHLLIVGGSYAALNTAAAARENGFGGRITMVSAEDALPYQRPPLSKAFLKGQMQESSLALKADAFYRDQDIDLQLGRTVTSIALDERKALLSGDGAIAFDILVFACGARVRRLPSGGEGVHYLRDLHDARSLKAGLDNADSFIVLGGGFVGLEVASAAVAMGKKVQLVEAAPRLLARAVPAEISQRLAALHQDAGLELISGAAAHAGNGRVQLTDGRTLRADLILAGLGAIPNAELAAEAGLAVDNGILVDDHGRASAPDVYAIGDCSNHVNLWAGRRMRLESVQNAIDQGRAAGATIAGCPTPYKATPRFWSDQYDCKLQMVGLCGEATCHESFEAPNGGFSMLHMRDGAVVGATSLNDMRTQVWARRVLAQGQPPLTDLELPHHLAPAAAELSGNSF